MKFKKKFPPSFCLKKKIEFEIYESNNLDPIVSFIHDEIEDMASSPHWDKKKFKNFIIQIFDS